MEIHSHALQEIRTRFRGRKPVDSSTTGNTTSTTPTAVNTEAKAAAHWSPHERDHVAQLPKQEVKLPGSAAS